MRRRSPIVGHSIALVRGGAGSAPRLRVFAQALICAAASLVAGCGGGGSTPPTPVYLPPTLTCPADIQASAVPGQPVAVTYATPAAVNGAPPVTVSCAPASGTTFDIGTGQVSCTATDAQSRSASCTFTVVVSETPQIDKVKFLAFGDSVTRGTVSSPCKTSESFDRLWLAMAEVVPESYPFKLQSLLASRYSSQTIDVVDEGVGGEPIAEGRSRLPGVLDSVNPQVLLLLHGYNDLLAAGRHDTFDSEIPRIAGELEEMVKIGHRKNVVVMLATFHAMDASGCRGAGAPGVTRLNGRIRDVAADEGASLVDLYGGLGGSPEGVVGIDGLHPTEDGYARMAQVWFDAIRSQFERPSATGNTGGPVLVVRTGDRIR